MIAKHARSRVSSRTVFAVMGWVCGMALGLLLYFVWKANELLLTFPPLAGMAFAIWYGEVTNKIPTADEINRPITLFADDRTTKKP